MAQHAETARQAFNLLLTTGNPRVHPHIYFGLPIKPIAIIFTFVDLLFNILPVMFAANKFRLIFIGVALLTRIAAFYVVFAPKLKYLNAYRALLLITSLASFAVNVLGLLRVLIDNEIPKLWIRHAFAVAGVLTPVEILCFITISAYAAYISSEEQSASPSAPPPPNATTESTQNPDATPSSRPTKTANVDEIEQKPLINNEGSLDDLD